MQLNDNIQPWSNACLNALCVLPCKKNIQWLKKRDMCICAENICEKDRHQWWHRMTLCCCSKIHGGMACGCRLRGVSGLGWRSRCFHHHWRVFFWFPLKAFPTIEFIVYLYMIYWNWFGGQCRCQYGCPWLLWLSLLLWWWWWWWWRQLRRRPRCWCFVVVVVVADGDTDAAVADDCDYEGYDDMMTMVMMIFITIIETQDTWWWVDAPLLHIHMYFICPTDRCALQSHGKTSHGSSEVLGILVAQCWQQRRRHLLVEKGSDLWIDVAVSTLVHQFTIVHLQMCSSFTHDMF